MHHYKNYAHQLLTIIPYEHNDNFCIFSESVVENVTFYVAVDDQSVIANLSAHCEGEFEVVAAEEIPKKEWNSYGNAELMPVTS